MKRVISCAASDFEAPRKKGELKEAILASEGRVVMAQTAVGNECMVPGVSNAELIAGFGADMVLLKVLDTENPCVCGVDAEGPRTVGEIKRLTGRLVGVNLEVIGANGFQYESGTVLCEKTAKSAAALEPDFMCLTAYRNKPGNTSQAVAKAVELVRKFYDGLLIVNKYASAKEVEEEQFYEEYIRCGADVLTLPMPGSVPGLYVENLAPVARRIKEAGGLVSMSVATSQEGSDCGTVQAMAIQAKQAGADLYDFGDAGQNGIPAVENIFALSMAVRGKRHTYYRMTQSINR